MSRLDEQLSDQFHQWEVRGRGWQVFEQPVYPEPPFVPFNGHYQPASPPIDDGRKPTFLSSLVQKLSTKLSPAAPLRKIEPKPEEELEPRIFVRDELIEFQVTLPGDLDIGKEAFEQFFRQLALCQEPIAFELFGSQDGVKVQFAASMADARLLDQQLVAYFPDVQFQTPEDSLASAWNDCTGEEMLVVEFGLAREFMLPLATGKLDPFIGMIGALAKLSPGDFGLFQVLFQPMQAPWAESIVNSVTHADGKPFFVDAPELVGAAERKIEHGLFAAVVRIAVKAETFERVVQLARDLAGSLRVFAHPQGNELIPLKNDDYPFAEHIEDVLRRQSRRSGMILNSAELTGFVHLPSSAVRTPSLQRITHNSKVAPAIVQGPGLLIGSNAHAGVVRDVSLSVEQRVRHTHIIGATGTGKSTLLFNMIRQDIENGEGLAVFDPHGDLVDKILGIIPPHRVKDVILVDPSDENFAIAFNILSAHSNLEKTLLASDLVSVFKRLSTSWGDQMDSVLRNAILAFLESSRRGTIADLRRFLIEPAFRKDFLSSVKDTEVLYYWQKSFPQLTGNKSVGPILTRLETFLAPKPIRYMVSQPENKLDFAQIMNTGKILLAKLPEGLLGKENSYLLGTLLMSKFQQMAMSRQAQEEASRRHFWIYADEFPNYMTPSLAEILSGARKYRIGLTLAHHELQQLQRNADVASAVMSHPFTRIFFRVGDDDAKKLGEGFSSFEASDLRNLEIGHAIARVERSDYDFNLTIPLPTPIDAAEAALRRKEVITRSREKYATAMVVIEAMLQKSSGEAMTIEPATSRPDLLKRIPEKVIHLDAKKLPETVEIICYSHSTIKQTVATTAESFNYDVQLEEAFKEIHAQADVVLRQKHRSVICQVLSTNQTEYEVESIRKFLNLNFTHIAVLSTSRKKLEHVRELLTESEQCVVGFYSLSEFMAQLQSWATDDRQANIIEPSKPRKRIIDFNAARLTEDERRQRENDLLRNLAQVMKQKRVP